jgi:threo-3-hydroxy-L-aspartate ammonia-lyase
MPRTLDNIRTSAKWIRPYAPCTPVLTNASLNEKVGARVYLKCENLQEVGAFKFRGTCRRPMANDVRAERVASKNVVLPET